MWRSSPINERGGRREALTNTLCPGGKNLAPVSLPPVCDADGGWNTAAGKVPVLYASGLFIPQGLCEIFAAIIQKADDFEQIRFLSGELADTIGETLRTHLPYMKRLGILEEEIRSARPHMDNSAYTHYMLWEAQAGDVLTGLVALLNCSWSYAYVAEKIIEHYPGALHDEHYGSWFAG